MKNTFGEFLKEKRLEKNLTQKDLAERLFVSASAVSKWEKDVAHPDITLLPKLSEILGVTEHELITASVDKQARLEKTQARKWRVVSFSWSLFFYIAYALALIPCFICNLAIDKTLSWFWIVAAALSLAFTFTNLPKLIRKNRLLWVPLSMLVSLFVLLAVCAIYSKGDWFWVAVLSILLGFLIIFTPTYIAHYKIFSKVRKYNDFITVGVAFILLNILLITCNFYSVANGYVEKHWYLKIGLPVTVSVYAILNVFLSVRFLKINRFLKTSAVLFLINLLYCIVPLAIQTKNVHLQEDLEDLKFYKADFSKWNAELFIDRNIHCIVFLTIAALGVIFLIVGLIRWHYKKKRA